MTDIAYEVGVPTNWTEGLKKLKVLEQEGVPVLVGPCPRCSHEIQHMIKKDAVGLGAIPSAAGDVQVLAAAPVAVSMKGAPRQRMAAVPTAASGYGCERQTAPDRRAGGHLRG